MADPNLELSGLANLGMANKICSIKALADLFDIQFTVPVLKHFSIEYII